jgi:hypothetical protein
MKFGIPNLLETYGPVQVFTGIALPYLYLLSKNTVNETHKNTTLSAV